MKVLLRVAVVFPYVTKERVLHKGISSKVVTKRDLLASENAMGQYDRIADEILTLDTFPERFRIMDSEPEKRMELRRMLVDNYSVIYTICDERVIVTDVLYTASDIEARLRGEI